MKNVNTSFRRSSAGRWGRLNAGERVCSLPPTLHAAWYQEQLQSSLTLNCDAEQHKGEELAPVPLLLLTRTNALSRSSVFC